MADAAAKLRKAESAAQIARAEAEVASANAQLTRAQIEANNRIERNWETGEVTVVPLATTAATKSAGSSVSGRRRGRVS